MKLLTNKQKESYENAKTCYICKVKFQVKYVIKLNVDMNMIIKTANRAELNTKSMSALLNVQELKMI